MSEIAGEGGLKAKEGVRGDKAARGEGATGEFAADEDERERFIASDRSRAFGKS